MTVKGTKEKPKVLDDGDYDVTLYQLAEEMGVTPQRVRQIQMRALEKLAQHPLARALATELFEKEF